jgi:ribosome biogenesis GTPase A
MAYKGQQKPHHESNWDTVKRIIRESDIILDILDSRLIEFSRNREVENIAKSIGRPLIFVATKSDLVSLKSLRKPFEELKKEGEVVFFSVKSQDSVKFLLGTIKRVFGEYGKREAIKRPKSRPGNDRREAKGDIVVGVLGYPNVGKSSVINALAHKKRAKVSTKSGTTHGVHWIKASDEIMLMDSPGVIPLEGVDEIRYGLIGARDTERIREPATVADAIIKLFMKEAKGTFEKFYGITIDEEDSDLVLEEIGRKKHFLVKGGEVDENRTAVLIIRDWQQGRLKI